MNKSEIIKFLVKLNAANSTVRQHEIQDECLAYLDTNTVHIRSQILSKISHRADPTEDTIWEFLFLNFYLVFLLAQEGDLSVQETKILKNCLQNIIKRGVLNNIQKKLTYSTNTGENSIQCQYEILKCSILVLNEFLSDPNLKLLVLPECLGKILVGVFQLAFCPLKKPSKDSSGGFIMTEELHAQLLLEQMQFKTILNALRLNIHPAIFVSELMSLNHKSSPLWFQKATGETLTRILKSDKGLQYIACSMLQGFEDDTTKTWQTIDVLTKLTLASYKSSSFNEISPQVLNLLDLDTPVFERLFFSITKTLFLKDEAAAGFFMEAALSPLRNLLSGHKFREKQDVTRETLQSIRFVHFLGLEDIALEHIVTLKPVLFLIYHVTRRSELKSTNQQLQELLNKQLKTSDFDRILFPFLSSQADGLRNDITLEVEGTKIIVHLKKCTGDSIENRLDSVLNVFSNRKVVLFGYLIKCVTEKNQYFPLGDDLTPGEEKAFDASLANLLIVYKYLSLLAEDLTLQSELRKNPDLLSEYIKSVADSSQEDLLFILVMIVESLSFSFSSKDIKKCQKLVEVLQNVYQRSSNRELKLLLEKILGRVKDNCGVKDGVSDMSAFEEALNGVSDPLVAVRGHALLQLTKLIEKMDEEAIENKQYLLNLLQLQLQDEDSYIYLNAAQALAAMTSIFPEKVLEVLCEEYTGMNKKMGEAIETRLKIGEVLMKSVKRLGETASKYKSLLLNTFLGTTKDEDNYMRASSLSNLGEVCQLLGYNLGSIIHEVLSCIHVVIATDKAVEARRAAVSVLRQLFVGLQGEMLQVLKDDILPIYRTLIDIYKTDKDEVTRLQAQLALEQLNENVKIFLTPKLINK